MTKLQSRVLLVSILASFVAFLDGTVVTVALPAITRELGGGLGTQQWVVDAYLITLGALMLTAGSLSDLFGRRRVLLIGLLGFGLASGLCAAAPTATVLIVARGLQGIAGALLVPSSLALIIGAFRGSAAGDDGAGKAIGTWTAWTGIAFIIGPLLGGILVDAASWRLIFAINIIPIAVTVWLMRGLVVDDQPQHAASIDVLGAMLCVVGLGGPVYGLIEQAHYGWSSPLIYGPLVVGILSFAAFLWHERRTPNPMLPLELFTVRNFSVGNLATMAIYSGLTVSGFLITVFVQQVGHYSALRAGLTMLPVTMIMFVLSPRFGAMASARGPRLFMAAGPLVASLGFFYMLLVDQSVNYWTQLFPGIILFGLGLSVTVAPLTTAILGSIDARHAGVGSAINNAVSRIAGLVAIAALGVVVGPTLNVASFHRGILVSALLLVVGAVISVVGIRNTIKS